MKLPFGFTISRKAAPATAVAVSDTRGWYRVLESFTGAWQRNVVVDYDSVLAYNAVYACMTLIAADISKLRVKLVQKDDYGVWIETDNAAFSPVLRKPNRYQTRNQFWECWMLSKLMRGNSYILKQRDNRQIVTALYVLDPNRVTVKVADDASVWYSLASDNLSGIETEITVPASEVIHDRYAPLRHPLIGTSPIYAAGVPATNGIAIQNSSSKFFENRSQPGGILTAPGAIGDETAARLKTAWETNFTGDNAGKVAVLGDGLKFESVTLTAEQSQLIEQLKWTADQVCAAFHVPAFKAGFGDMPANSNIQSLNVEYYTRCLQKLIEDAESCLDDGLGIGDGVNIGGKILGTEFDTDNLLRMDSLTQMEMLDKGAGKMEVNEMRKVLNLPKTEGGDAVFVQQQNFSVQALAERDADKPFAKPTPAAPAAPATPADPANDNSDAARAARSLQRRAKLAAELGLETIPLTKADTGTAVA